MLAVVDGNVIDRGRETFISRRSLALLLTAARSGVARHEQVEVAPVEHQELAEIDRDHVGRAPLAAEQRHLAEEGAGFQPDRLGLEPDFHRTRGDEEHRVAAVALADHPLAGRGGARPEQQQQLLLVLGFDVGKQREGFEQLLSRA